MLDHDNLKSALASTPDCLTAEQLEPLLDGKQSNPHLAQCARCQAELAMLKSFETGAALPDEGAAVAWIGAHLDRQLAAIKSPSRRSLSRTSEQSLVPPHSWLSRTFGGMRWVMPAAALAVIAVAGAIMLKPGRAPDLQANAGGQSTIYRSQELEVVDPVGDVPHVPSELRWQQVAGAKVYKVTMMEIDHSQVWASETNATTVVIPASVRAKILPGKPILWQVTALDDKSQILANSQLEKFVSATDSSDNSSPH